MKKLQDYLKRKLIKRQRPNFKQIKQQLEGAEHDLKEDPGWASAIAYQSMLRARRALMFAHGFLPIDGQQHKTVVEITGKLLNPAFETIIKQFDRLRKNRNIFFYDSVNLANKTEAEIAVKTAKKLLEEITKQIGKLNPQGNIFNTQRDNNKISS